MSKLAKSAKRTGSEIARLRVRYAKAKRQHFQEIYQILERAQHVITVLTKNKSLARKVMRGVRKLHPKCFANGQSLSQGVLMTIMGPNSRKLAWKRARVLDYLRKEGIPDGEIAKNLGTRGGLESLVRKAAAEDGKPSVRWAGTKTSNRGPRSVPTRGTNDKQVVEQVRIRLSDLDSIRSSAVGSEILLFARRVGQQVDLNVVKVVIRNAKAATATEQDDADEEM